MRKTTCRYDIFEKKNVVLKLLLRCIEGKNGNKKNQKV